jgi:hypothetical protein
MERIIRCNEGIERLIKKETTKTTVVGRLPIQECMYIPEAMFLSGITTPGRF